MIDVRAENWNL